MSIIDFLEHQKIFYCVGCGGSEGDVLTRYMVKPIKLKKLYTCRKCKRWICNRCPVEYLFEEGFGAHMICKGCQMKENLQPKENPNEI